MTDTTTDTATHGVNVTDVAAGKVRSLLEQEGRDDLRLRVAVQPGGCSGLIYQLYFDERVLEGDALRDYDGVEVVVDKMSVPYLEGATHRLQGHHRASRASRSTTRTPAARAPAAGRSPDRSSPHDRRAGHLRGDRPVRRPWLWARSLRLKRAHSHNDRAHSKVTVSRGGP